VKYGEVRHREEVEQSKFVFNQGVELPPDMPFGKWHRDVFESYYAMAEALLKSGLIWPALEHTLKCSHLFNILDSSNSIGVTERTNYILRVRKLAVGIAQAYVGDRAGRAEAQGEGGLGRAEAEGGTA
jgi:glycyl-tRNA synthetase alpha chain